MKRGNHQTRSRETQPGSVKQLVGRRVYHRGAMAISHERIREQLRSVEQALRHATGADGQMSPADARRLMTRADAAIARFASPNSSYWAQSEDVLHDEGALAWKAEQLCAIVSALREDYEFGALESVTELVHADLFDDFLGIAGELRAKGFLGPAAVVAGSVLEEHLRKLADKHKIARLDARRKPKSAETLSVELRKAGAFTELQRKSLQAWYAQRNAAAHVPGDPMVEPELDRMIDGIRDFVARHPA